MADTITYQYDKANGRLQFQFINHADGTWDVWQWDTQNQYAFAWQVFHGVGSGGNSLLSVGVQNDDGTYLAETFDTSHGGALAQSTLLRPDKSFTRWTYDTANLQAWSSCFTEVNAAGRVVDEGGVFDSGVRWTTWYDLAHGGAASLYDVVLTNGTHQQVAWYTVGNQPWSSYTQDVSAAGQTIDQVLTLRAGGTETRVFDMAHGGALQTDTTTRPDGTMTKYVYDTGHANTWSWSKLNQVGTHLTDQLFVMRDGTQELNLFDTAHGDKLLSHAVMQADGSQVQTVWDTGSENLWDHYVVSSDSSGKQATQTFTNRDGSKSVVISDSSATRGWSKELNVFNSQNHLVSRTDYVSKDAVVV